MLLFTGCSFSTSTRSSRGSSRFAMSSTVSASFRPLYPSF